MRKSFALALLPAVVALGGCDGVGQALTSHTDVLARAAGHELTVDRAASLIAPQAAIPAQPEVVEAVASLWVDYTLLATAANQDSTLANVNLDLLLRPYIEQEVVWKLREAVISVDTAISEDELRQLFEQEQPGLQVRARHILLSLSPDAPQQVRDSVTRLAQDLQRRAAGGEDFAALARQYSADGSAPQGGDLGFFGRGQMVQPFEEAAFALEPGQVSDVVQTPFGLHIIKVEERQTASFEEMRDSFRASASQLKVQQAEEKYITDLTEPRNIQVQPGAVENAKEMARNPAMSLSGRAADRALVRYDGGALTAAEFLDVMRGWNPQNRGGLAQATDEQIEQVLEGLSRNEILIEEARRQNLDMSAAEQDSLRLAARMQLKRAAQEAGLVGIQPQDGETMNQAIERKVNTSMEAILKGEQNVVPLGPLSFSLRQQFGGEVFNRAIDETVSRVMAMRPPQAPQGLPGVPQPNPGGTTPPPATTTGQ